MYMYKGKAGRIQIANDVSPNTYEVSVPILDNGSRDADTPQTVADKTVHLRIDDKEAADNQPVYVNNYSGSGTVCTADGFYRLGFYVE